MDSRRVFIKKIGTGALAASILPTTTIAKDRSNPAYIAGRKDDFVIGVIGAENSHTEKYSKLFNIDNIYPGIKVGYVWGETKELATRAKKIGNIPNIVKDPLEMVGEIDALIVDHRHAKYHIPAATQFIETGIPIFIDKPFCYRAENGKQFLKLARHHGTPVTSYSSVAHSRSMENIKKQVTAFEKIHQVVMYGPVDIYSNWGGIFYYGAHMVQQIMQLFGEDIEKVRITKSGNKATATLVYPGGMPVTLIFSNFNSGWSIFAETETGYHELKSRVWDSEPEKSISDMVDMFRTGKEPRSHQSILNGVSILEGLEASVYTEQWLKIKYVTE